MKPGDFKEFGDFSGGIIDDQDGRPDAFASEMENFELLHNKKIRVRPGTALLGPIETPSNSIFLRGNAIQAITTLGSFSSEDNFLYFLFSSQRKIGNIFYADMSVIRIEGVKVGEEILAKDFTEANGVIVKKSSLNPSTTFSVENEDDDVLLSSGIFKGVFAEFGSNVFLVNKDLIPTFKIYTSLDSSGDSFLNSVISLPNFELTEDVNNFRDKLLIRSRVEEGDFVVGNSIDLITLSRDITQDNLNEFVIGKLVVDDDAVLDKPNADNTGTEKRVITGNSSSICTKSGREGEALQEIVIGGERVRYGDIKIRSESVSLESFGTTPQANYVAESIDIHILEEDADKFDTSLAMSLESELTLGTSREDYEIFPESIRDVEFTRQNEFVQPFGTSRRLVVFRKSNIRKTEGSVTTGRVTSTTELNISKITTDDTHIYVAGGNLRPAPGSDVVAFNKSDGSRDTSKDFTISSTIYGGEYTILDMAAYDGNLFLLVRTLVTDTDSSGSFQRLGYFIVGLIRDSVTDTVRTIEMGRLSRGVDRFSIQQSGNVASRLLTTFWNYGVTSNETFDTRFDSTISVAPSETTMIQLDPYSAGGVGLDFNLIVFSFVGTRSSGGLGDVFPGRQAFFLNLTAEDFGRLSNNADLIRVRAVLPGQNNPGNNVFFSATTFSSVFLSESTLRSTIPNFRASRVAHVFRDFHSSGVLERDLIYIIPGGTSNQPATRAYAFDNNGVRKMDNDVVVTQSMSTDTRTEIPADSFPKTQTQRIVEEHTSITANFRYGPDFDNLGPVTVTTPSHEGGTPIQIGDEADNPYAFAFVVKRTYKTEDNREFVERTRVQRTLRNFVKPIKKGEHTIEMFIDIGELFLCPEPLVTQLTPHPATAPSPDLVSRQNIARQAIRNKISPNTVAGPILGQHPKLSLEIYRTKIRQSEYFLIGEIDVLSNDSADRFSLRTPGSTSGVVFESDLEDDELDGRLGLYTNGGEVDNDPPPPNCLSMHIVRGAAFYIKDNRLYQSKIGQFDRVPDTFFLDFEENLTAIFSADRHLIVTTANRVYLIEGLFTSLGTGGLTAQEIYSTDGCLGPTAYARGEKTAYFLGSAGIYVCDGFKVVRITDSLNKTYREFIENADSISCALDESKKKIYISNEKRTWVLDYRHGFSTYFWVNKFINRAPKELIVYRDTLLEAYETRLYQKKDTYFRDDIKIDLLAVDNDLTNIQSFPINMYFESVRLNFGTGVLRKWINRVGLNVFSTGPSFLDVFIKRDRKETKYGVTKFRVKPKFEWREATFKWRDPEFKWRPFSGFFPLSKRIDGSKVRINSIALGIESSPTVLGTLTTAKRLSLSVPYLGFTFYALIFDKSVKDLGLTQGDTLVAQRRDIGREYIVVFAGDSIPSGVSREDRDKTAVIYTSESVNDSDLEDNLFLATRIQGSQGLEIQSLGINVTSTTHSDKEIDR